MRAAPVETPGPFSIALKSPSHLGEGGRGEAEVGWGRLEQGRTNPHPYRLALPTRSLRDHPPPEGEGESGALTYCG